MNSKRALLCVDTKCCPEAYLDVIPVLLSVLRWVHRGNMTAACDVWDKFTAWEPLEKKALIAEYHLDRTGKAMRALGVALANYDACLRLDHVMAEPTRLAEVREAHILLQEYLDDMRVQYWPTDEDAPDTERCPGSEAA